MLITAIAIGMFCIFYFDSIWKSITAAFITGILIALFFSGSANGSENDLNRLFYAIQQVETGGEEDPNNAVGDGGKALGPYQIWYAYWYDATHRPGNPDRKVFHGEYDDVRDPLYAKQIMIRYWKRYVPKALEEGDFEVLARVHNGGPSGHKRDSTKPYWEKVNDALSRK